MRRWLVVFVCLATATVSAQWPRYVPPGMPSTAGPPVATFFDVGKNVPGGLPFTPRAAALRAARVARRTRIPGPCA